MLQNLRDWKNRTFLDWQWDVLVGGACGLLGLLFGNPILGLIFALGTNALSWYLNRIFELKDFLLRLLIPLIFLAV